MIIFDAIAPEGSRERLRFETQAEADAAADQHRAAGHGITWIHWSETHSASSPSPRSEQP